MKYLLKNLSNTATIFILVIVTIICFTSNNLTAQTAHSHLRKGDRSYQNNQLSDAETQYRKAEELKPSLKSGYNLGNTLYGLERYEEAEKAYSQSQGRSNTDTEKSALFHNLGNTYFNQKKYKESIEAYKQALKHNPEDTDTKQNLMYARTLMKQQQQEQQQQNQNDNQNQQDKEEQQNNDQNENNENQEQDQNEQKDSDQNEGDQKESAPKEQSLSREDAEKLLNIIDNEDKNVQEKMRKAGNKNKKLKRDW